MDLSHTEEQQLFRKSVREFVTDRVPPERLAEIADGEEGWDPALWKEAAGLGLAGISVPEEQGGAGMGFVEEAIVAEELGRGVFPGPWLGSVILAQPALQQAPALLQAVATGERIATWVPSDGTHVVDLAAADLLVSHKESSIVAIDKEGVEWRVLPTVDGTRRLGQVELGDVRGEPIADSADAAAILERVRVRALAALAAEAAGVAERALEIATEYAREREQFGIPIGKFQAVSHQLADTYMDVELTRSLALWAAAAIAEDDPDRTVASETAKAFAADAAVRACERAIQVHGGIGFTWEHPLHRYYKRALWIRAFLASGDDLRGSVAERIIT
ncbi:MAG: acyl-CoA dehydrogenase family protein [Actinomycetota bacterium]